MATSTTTAGRLNARQAAAHVEVHISTWYEWLKTGALEAVTHRTPTGSRYWFADELDTWLRSRCSEGDAA